MGRGNTKRVEEKGGRRSQRKEIPVDQSFPHGFHQLVPTCICRGALGLERQNIVRKRDLDFHCCTLKQFHDIQDSHKQCCQSSQKLLGFFFFIISCQEREGHKQIFLYFEKDVLFYNILKERKQTSLANAF